MPRQHFYNRTATSFISGWTTLVIEHVITPDDPCDGGPVVPGIINIDDDAFWARVRCLPGHRTLWRRIFISSPVAEWRAASGDLKQRAP